MEVEAQRLANIEYKSKLLSDLNLHSEPVRVSTKRDRNTDQVTKKRRLDVNTAPTRTSARIASASVRPSYQDELDEAPRRTGKQSKGRSKGVKNEDNEAVDVKVNASVDAEEIRAGWARWIPSAAPPTRDEDGIFHFEDYPDFTPNKSPEEVIREGCFGGSYFRPLRSRRLGILVQDDWQELPYEWHSGLDVNKYLTSPDYDADVNKFKVSCGQSIEEWEANGWIAYEHDIRGWFQWYCRFWLGRRCEDDQRQVSRWKKCVGETGRWKRTLLKKYIAMGVRDVFDDGEDDKEVSPVIHQTCHHWAYQVLQSDLDKAWQGR
jgi:hypothetical protein